MDTHFSKLYHSAMTYLTTSNMRPITCSPMRAERAKPKSCKDDEIIAQGKRSAALGYGCKMIPPFFPSGFARPRRAKSEGKKEHGWGGSLPRAAASAALPWAIILLPLRGAGEANQRAGGDGGMSALFHAGRLWPALPEQFLHLCQYPSRGATTVDRAT